MNFKTYQRFIILCWIAFLLLICYRSRAQTLEVKHIQFEFKQDAMNHTFNIYTPKNSNVGSKLIKLLGEVLELKRIENEHRNIHSIMVSGYTFDGALRYLRSLIDSASSSKFFPVNYFFFVGNNTDEGTIENLGMTKVFCLVESNERIDLAARIEVYCKIKEVRFNKHPTSGKRVARNIQPKLPFK